MSGEFAGRVALVTGGGSGIGAATAELLRRSGAEVVILGPGADRIEAVAARTGATPVIGLAGPRSAVITGAVLMADLGASTADLSLSALGSPE